MLDLYHCLRALHLISDFVLIAGMLVNAFAIGMPPPRGSPVNASKIDRAAPWPDGL